MLTMEDIRSKIEEIFDLAEKYNLAGVAIRAGSLHRLVNENPNKENRTRMCCVSMRKYMKPTDLVLSEPLSGEGASLEILYKVPFR